MAADRARRVRPTDAPSNSAVRTGRRRPPSPAARARRIADSLAAEYPDAVCELDHRTPFELLAATILSAQCTDARVNMVTPALFARFPDAEALARADPAEVEDLIRPTGFFQTKARHLVAMASALVERFDGAVPTERDDLVSLAGVGRKTANVVRSVAFGLPGLPVDTHVGRLGRRLGLTAHDDPVKVEADLCRHLPPEEWGDFSLRLILHGRRVCLARRPRCGECVLADVCPAAGTGVPPPRSRHATGQRSSDS